MQIFSLEESMSKAHVFHRLCSLANSGTFLLSALGLEYDAKVVYKEVHGTVLILWGVSHTPQAKPKALLLFRISLGF